MTDSATVFVVDDDDSVRRSLHWLLESIGLTVISYDSADAFLEGYVEDGAGCLVLDVRMPGMSGLELHAILAERNILLPVIIVTGHADVPMAVRALQAGAFDFIEKPFNDQRLIDRIHEAIEEDALRREDRRQLTALRSRIRRLSPREHQVMLAVVAGHTNKQIATDLTLSVKTVESHRAQVMVKMEASSLSALIAAVLRDQGKP